MRVAPSARRLLGGGFSSEDVMADDLQNRGPQDRARINLNEEWEVRYWTRELGVTEEALRSALCDAEGRLQQRSKGP
ncbi:DUF3606 domain-containing protein [Bordetella flabilis]|uniref:DUF3606 domain-containing protein n=2 Tax=Bordetella flabilis TaxID=463014 RepID=UPI0039F05809